MNTNTEQSPDLSEPGYSDELELAHFRSNNHQPTSPDLERPRGLSEAAKRGPPTDEHGAWPLELRQEVEALEEKWDIELVSGADHNRLWRDYQRAVATLPRAVGDEGVERAARIMNPRWWADFDTRLRNGGATYEASWQLARDEQMHNMRAALATLPPAPGWRGIESAPRDGTPVLTYCAACATPKNSEVMAVNSFGVGAEGWWGRCANGIVMIAPTHWMPLPSPPSPSEEVG